MEPNYQNAAMLDMIFENRNQAYGAYVLRRDYNHTLQQAMLIILSSIVLLGVGQFVHDKMAKNYIAGTDGGTIVTPQDLPTQKFTAPVPTTPPTPPPPDHNKNGAQASNTVADAEKKVTSDNHTADSISNADALKDHDIGLHTNTTAPIGGLGLSDGTGKELSLAAASTATAPLPTDPTRTPDVMPVFPGGEKALMAYLASHTEFPAYLREIGVEGKVISEFTVNENGTVSDVKILRTPNEGFNKEVIGAVKSLPAFSPGMQGGQPVKVRYVVPLIFKLNK